MAIHCRAAKNSLRGTLQYMMIVHVPGKNYVRVHILCFCVIAIYAPMTYMAPFVMFWMREIHYEGKWRGLGPGNQDLFGPCEMASSRLGECHLGPKKVEISRAGPPPIRPSKGSARIKYIMYRAV